MVLKPSRRQKQIVALREEARRCGLQVQFSLDTVSDETGRHSASVRYLLPWLAKDLEHVDTQHWLLIRDNGRGLPSSWVGWRWQGRQAPVSCQQAIVEGLADLPDTVNGLCSNAQGMGAYWQERGELEEVAIIDKALRKISNNMK